MPKTVFSVHNVSDERVSVETGRGPANLESGQRDTYREILNKTEVARKCVVHLNGRQVYESLLEVDRDGVSDDGSDVEVDKSAEEPMDEPEEEAEEEQDAEQDEDDDEEADLAEVLNDFDYSDLQSLAGNEDDIQGNASKEDIVDGLVEKYSYDEMEEALDA